LYLAFSLSGLRQSANQAARGADTALPPPAGSSRRRLHARRFVARNASVGHKYRIVYGGGGIPKMATGTVKWFNTTKGYGFIQPQSGGKDVFVHITAVQAAGLRGLNEGQRVTYDVLVERGKESAGNLKVE
jgi:CspA family cold shock protein